VRNDHAAAAVSGEPQVVQDGLGVLAKLHPLHEHLVR